MKAHLGNKIKELLDEKRISVREFAKQIGVTPNSAYVMLKKELLHPKWVEIMSETLNHDLFQYVYTSAPDSSISITKDDLKAAIIENQLLKRKNEEMAKEISYLKEINILLKNKKK